MNEQLTELMRAVGRIEGKLDAMIDLPARVAGLEQRESKRAGMIAGIAAVVGALAAWLREILFR